MNSVITLTLPGEIVFTRFASQTALKAAEHFISTCSGENVSWEFPHAFELAVSEAFTNAVRYSERHSTPTQPVIITFILGQQRLTVTVRDTNPAFTTETPLPDIDSFPERGFGLHIIRSVMDMVSYRRKNGSNIISMSKQL
jgi:serine/threonine-protein kinase RsbW